MSNLLLYEGAQEFWNWTNLNSATRPDLSHGMHVMLCSIMDTVTCQSLTIEVPGAHLLVWQLDRLRDLINACTKVSRPDCLHRLPSDHITSVADQRQRLARQDASC